MLLTKKDLDKKKNLPKKEMTFDELMKLAKQKNKNITKKEADEAIKIINNPFE